MDQPIGLMLIIAVLAIWLQQYWLAGVMAVVLGLVLVSNIEIRRPVAAPAGGREEEILTPVVVQDIGEPPYLYPPNFDLKLSQTEKLLPRHYVASRAFGKFARVIIRTARGDKHAYLKKKKVRFEP